jgi:hypothetical protein
MPEQEKDLRKYSAVTQRGMILGGLAVIVAVGLALIYMIYGPAGALMGALCFVGLLAPMLLIAGFLALLQWIVRRAHPED